MATCLILWRFPVCSQNGSDLWIVDPLGPVCWGLASMDQTCSSMSYKWFIRFGSGEFGGLVKTLLFSPCCSWAVSVVSRGIHMNASAQGFPAEHCIVMRWSVSFTSPFSGFYVVADCCMSTPNFMAIQPLKSEILILKLSSQKIPLASGHQNCAIYSHFIFTTSSFFVVVVVVGGWGGGVSYI